MTNYRLCLLQIRSKKDLKTARTIGYSFTSIGKTNYAYFNDTQLNETTEIERTAVELAKSAINSQKSIRQALLSGRSLEISINLD